MVVVCLRYNWVVFAVRDVGRSLSIYFDRHGKSVRERCEVNPPLRTGCTNVRRCLQNGVHFEYSTYIP